MFKKTPNFKIQTWVLVFLIKKEDNELQKTFT